MSGERLSALCMTDVHSEKISKDKPGSIEMVIDRFGRDFRRLEILFPSDADVLLSK